MPEISYKELERWLKSSEQEKIPQVWLIHGEEFLCKSALNYAVNFLLPESSKTLNYSPMEGSAENVSRAIEVVNTYSLIPGRKVAALQEARVFYSKKDKAGLLKKTKSAAGNNELKKAAGFLITLMNRMDLQFEDLKEDNRSKKLGAETEESLEWLDPILEYCVENNLSVSAEESDSAGMIIRAMEKGFPAGHFLIVTADLAVKKHKLFKAILKEGLIIDCAVPKGERKADKAQQESVLSERMHAVLSRAGKNMENRAYRIMVDMIGFDIRAFVNELEKLVNYVGERTSITAADVQNVLKRSRRDPIFEFTNAVTERNLQKSLFLLESMLISGMHPLQLLTAMANQARRLLYAKSFVKSRAGTVWQEGASYGYFQKSVAPALIEYDRDLSERVAKWEQKLKPEKEGQTKKIAGRKKNKKTAAKSDLFLVKNPKSLFPAYQTIKKSDNFNFEELKDFLKVLTEADALIKSTAQDPKRILENALFQICRL